MKTLTAFVALFVGLTASAQTPSLQASDVDFESLISMHSVAELVRYAVRERIIQA